MIRDQPSVFWGRAIRRGVVLWVGVRVLFSLASVLYETLTGQPPVGGLQPSIAGSLLALGVVGVLSSVQIVAMRERSFYGNAGLDRLPLVVPVLAAIPLEIVLAIVAGAA